MILRDELEEFNEYQFDEEASIKEATEILDEYIEEYQVPYFQFEDDVWHIDQYLRDNNRKIKFEKLFNELGLENEVLDKKKKVILKCWVSSLIGNFSASTIINYFNGLIKFAKLTSNFTDFNLENTLVKFNKLTISSKNEICNSVSNLLDYYWDYFKEDSHEIFALIQHFSNTYDTDYGVRKLPKTKDILVFNNIINDFFKKNLDLTTLKKWLPIYFWWRLTIIIPMRASEYAKLTKHCIYSKGDVYYLKIKRVKANQNIKDIEFLTEILIPKKLYVEMQEYLEITSETNTSNTFICFKSILKASNARISSIKRFDFNANRLNKLIVQFYEEIVYGEYNFILSKRRGSKDICYIERQLLPNDTRHLAFINLKRQGYHPVEVAKIGGHSTLRSQEHYFSHLNNFLDLEIVALFSNNRIGEYKQSININFVNEYILKPANTSYKLKLDYGYCTDQEMNCRVEECWLCENWRITGKEFELKKEMLEEMINQRNDEVSEIISSFEKLYSEIYSNYKLSKFDFDMSIRNEKIKLNNVARSLDSKISKLLDINKLKTKIEEDKHR